MSSYIILASLFATLVALCVMWRRGAVGGQTGAIGGKIAGGAKSAGGKIADGKNAENAALKPATSAEKPAAKFAEKSAAKSAHATHAAPQNCAAPQNHAAAAHDHWMQFHSQTASSYEVGGAGYDMGSAVTTNNDLAELEAASAPAQIRPQNLMNEAEMTIYFALAGSALARVGAFVAPQVAMSEFLLDPSKRLVKQRYYGLAVDFLIAQLDEQTKQSKPLFVVEFHGRGHFGDGENDDEKRLNKERDELKKELLREAGLALFVINYWGVCNEKTGKIDGRKLRFAVRRILLAASAGVAELSGLAAFLDVKKSGENSGENPAADGEHEIDDNGEKFEFDESGVVSYQI